ncbi:MAG TPA: helix-turn-helix transcriptional regulator [Peptococcaceae bacterium]|nr:helix-turn-helix transcriptional regulator [Peptococcaceae bacterium]
MGFLEQLLAHIPPHPLKDKVEAYPGKDMVIFKPNIIFEGPFCSHHYQFVLPLSDAPSLIVEKQSFPIEQNKLFPINPEQVHGAHAQREVQGYLTILIKKETLQEMAKSAFGKADISFKNVFTFVDSEARHLINQFMFETANRQLGYEFIQEGITLQLAINFLRRLKSNLFLEKSERSSPRESINKAIEFLNECYNEDFSLEDIARVANLSPYHFVRVFKAETGVTPHQYLMNIRIKRVKEMLADKNLSISQAFSYCGMDYNGHFAALFKRKEGLTPSQYRKLVLGKDESQKGYV